jgi:hypothetical protein
VIEKLEMSDLDLLPIVEGKLFFYAVNDDKNRLVIHTYMEKHHPNIFKMSLTCSHLGINKNAYYKCECGSLIKMDYHYGYMENNYDEYFTGTCNNCNYYTCYECNMEGLSSKVIFLNRGNIILYGDKNIFGGYENRKHRGVKKDYSYAEFEQVLTHSELYMIDTPSFTQGKKKLSEHITKLFESGHVILVRKSCKNIVTKFITNITITNKPIINTTIKNKPIMKTCRNCLVLSVNLKRCARCKITYYCNIQCQSADWEIHKTYCMNR